MMIEDILKIICHQYEISRTQIGTKVQLRDAANIVIARQTAAHFIWGYTRLSNEQIANILGYHSRQNVIMARKKVLEVAEGDKNYREVLAAIADKIVRK